MIRTNALERLVEIKERVAEAAANDKISSLLEEACGIIRMKEEMYETAGERAEAQADEIQARLERSDDGDSSVVILWVAAAMFLMISLALYMTLSSLGI